MHSTIRHKCIFIPNQAIGGGGFHGDGVDEVSGRKWSAIQREVSVQAKCMTWLLAYFDVSWVVHGGPQLQASWSHTDAMEVRRGQGHVHASLGQIALRHGQCEARLVILAAAAASILPCVLLVI